MAVIYIPRSKIREYHMSLDCDRRLRHRGVVVDQEMIQNERIPLRPCIKCYDTRGYIVTAMPEKWEEED